MSSASNPTPSSAPTPTLTDTRRRAVHDASVQVGRERSDQSGFDADNPPAIAQSKVVWMFGARRTGSTWFAQMLSDLPRIHKWGEPLIGELIGGFYYRLEDKIGRNHIFAPEFRDLWLSWIRRLVCEGAAARASRLIESDGFMVIRDPHGTVGAPILCEALPHSKLIVLVRDPRDIVASMADAHQLGGWMGERAVRRGRLRRVPKAHQAEVDPLQFARQHAQRVVAEFTKAGEAFDLHRGPKTLVRYEDLRTDTVNEVTRVCRELEIDATPEAIAESVAKNSWERVPEEEKGSGKFHRKASPGSWAEDLQPKQARMIERVSAPVLDAYYAGWRESGPRPPS